MKPPSEESWLEAEPIWDMDSEEAMVWLETMKPILYLDGYSVLGTLARETSLLVKSDYPEGQWFNAYESLLVGRDCAVSPVRSLFRVCFGSEKSFTLVNHYNQSQPKPQETWE